MMRVQDRALLTATELALIESSEPLRIRAYSPAQLNDRIVRARRLWDKYRGLAREQERRTKKILQPGRPQPFSNLRTERKAKVFSAALKRFEQRLEQLARLDRRKPRRRAKPLRKSSRRSLIQQDTIRKEQQRRLASSQSATAPRIARQFRKSRMRAIQGHIRARGKGRQAKRDAR